MTNRQTTEMEKQLSTLRPFGSAPATLRGDVSSIVQKSLHQQMRWDDFKLVSKSIGLIFIAAASVLASLSFQANYIKSMVSSDRPAPGLLEFRDGYRQLTGERPPAAFEKRFLLQTKTRRRAEHRSLANFHGLTLD